MRRRNSRTGGTTMSEWTVLQCSKCGLCQTITDDHDLGGCDCDPKYLEEVA